MQIDKVETQGFQIDRANSTQLPLFKRIVSWNERINRQGNYFADSNYYASDTANTRYRISHFSKSPVVELEKWQYNNIVWVQEFDTITEAMEFAEKN